MHAVGISISEKHAEIGRLANRLLLLQPTHIPMLLTYSRYLNDIINNEYYALDIFSLAFSQRLTFKLKGTESIGHEEAFFGDSGFCSLLILRTDFKNLGSIEFANHETHTLFGYKSEQLVGRDVAVIMPDLIGD